MSSTSSYKRSISSSSSISKTSSAIDIANDVIFEQAEDDVSGFGGRMVLEALWPFSGESTFIKNEEEF